MCKHPTGGSNPSASANYEGRTTMRMDTDIAFVKEQILAQDKMVVKYGEQPNRAALHSRTKARFEELLAKLIEIQDKKEPATSPAPLSVVTALPGIHLLLSDIEGAPQELLDELSLSDSDRQEMVIADIIQGVGGIASLDKIIVLLHKRTGAITKRNTLVSKLFRMAEKRMIFNVPGKRGIYAAYEIKEDDVEKLFGKVQSEGCPRHHCCRDHCWRGAIDHSLGWTDFGFARRGLISRLSR
jgi:hypothetical protein